jgi:ketosteroid isomerase-like protein
VNTTDEAAITGIFVQELPSMVRAGDVDGYMGLWGGGNCRWCPQDVPDARGTGEIREAVASLFAQFTIDPSFEADEAAACESKGYVLGTSTERLQPKGGGPSTVLNTRELWLFVKEEAGWKINCMVFNHKPS